MLVKCDKCGQSYEVNDARLSPQGARIKCPSCANIFLVRLEGNGNSKSSAAKPDAATPGSDGIPLKTGAEENWKVRHMGLTYTFHDLSSLQDWLSGRPSLEDVKVARDEDDWKELGDYPGVLTTELITKFFPLGDVPTSRSKSMDALGTGTASGEQTPFKSTTTLNGMNLPLMSASSFAPVSVSSDLNINDDAKAVQKRKIEAKRRAEAEEANRKKWKKYIILLVIVLAAGIIAGSIFMRGGLDAVLHKNGTDIAQEPVPATAPAPEVVTPKPAPKDVVPAPSPEDEAENKIRASEEAARLEDEDFQRRIKESEQMIKNRQWPEARATLETMLKERPNDIPALQLLAKTYRGLNLPSKAAEVDATIKKLKAAEKENPSKNTKAIDFDDEK